MSLDFYHIRTEDPDAGFDVARARDILLGKLDESPGFRQYVGLATTPALTIVLMVDNDQLWKLDYSWSEITDRLYDAVRFLQQSLGVDLAFTRLNG